MPMTPFMGVRISWLMLARNVRLEPRRFEGLSFRAWAKAASNRRRSVISRKMTVIVTREPDQVTCDADTSAGNSLPSFLRHQISPCGPVCRRPDAR